MSAQNDWFWIGEGDKPALTLEAGVPGLFAETLYPWDEVNAVGVDEAGRGCLAGPVCAAAVILDRHRPIVGLNDSKQLSAHERDALAEEIRAKALAWCVAWGSEAEIDTHNILQATVLAMKRAVLGLTLKPTIVMIDGNYRPRGFPYPVTTLVEGDARVAQIAAASILAKTSRDALMVDLDKTYPQYGFAQHMGYGTRQHLAAIAQFGVTPIHRKTFKPIRDYLNEHTSEK